VAKDIAEFMRGKPIFTAVARSWSQNLASLLPARTCTWAGSSPSLAMFP